MTVQYWRVGLCLCLLTQVQVQAAEDCALNAQGQRSFCVRTVSGVRGVQLYVRNQQLLPLTIELTLELENLRSDRPLLQVYPPQKETLALGLIPRNPTQPWHWRYWYNWQVGDYTAQPNLNYAYRLPVAPKQSVLLTQGFNGAFTHTGESQYCVDWRLDLGTPIYAAREGIVVAQEDRFQEGGMDRAKYAYKANFITLLHPDRTLGNYLHLATQGVRVNLGQRVQAGQFLGLSGNTGFSSEPHLHFCVTHPKDARSQTSIPFKILTTEGVVTPQENSRYQAP